MTDMVTTSISPFLTYYIAHHQQIQSASCYIQPGRVMCKCTGHSPMKPALLSIPWPFHSCPCAGPVWGLTHLSPLPYLLVPTCPQGGISKLHGLAQSPDIATVYYSFHKTFTPVVTALILIFSIRLSCTQ